MLLASAAQILPVIMGEGSGMICGQTKGSHGSQHHSLKSAGVQVQGRRDFQLVQAAIPAEGWLRVSEPNSCIRQAHILAITYPKHDFYSLKFFSDYSYYL